MDDDFEPDEVDERDTMMDVYDSMDQEEQWRQEDANDGDE